MHTHIELWLLSTQLLAGPARLTINIVIT